MSKSINNLRALFVWIPACVAAGTSCQHGGPPAEQIQADSLHRIRYNNPDLVVPLGVGLCSLPMPVDYNGDGLVDLLVTAGQDVPDGYTYYFENTGRKENGIDIFKPAVRIGPKHEFYTPSYVKGQLRVLGFNREYDLHNLEESWEIYPDQHIHPSKGRIRANQWSYVDFEGNGAMDLVVGVGDWGEYGWDDAFNEKGEWTSGPLHGYVYLIRNNGTTDQPEYEKPVKIETVDGNPVDVYGRPSPNFADFNGDGALDLITGDFIDKLSFFRNIGTREEPRYAPGVYLSLDGEPIRLKGCMIRPTAYDWNRDGHMDLVVGSEDGSVALIRNTGTIDEKGVPVFDPPVYFLQIAYEVKSGVLVTPFGVDWNGDGKEDLIAGNAAGQICFIENLGGAPPKWAKPRKLAVKGKEVRILAGYNGSIQGPAEAKWGYTALSVADWNHDHLPDIIVNSIYGSIYWFENIGTITQPELDDAKPIEVEWPGAAPKPAWNWWNPVEKQLVTQWRSTPQAIDLNRDGLTDLVALDQEGFLTFFERRKIRDELKLLPPRRIFHMEKGSPSVFDANHRVIDPAMGEGLAGYDGQGNLAYFGRKWDGDHWGPYTITQRIPGNAALSSTGSEKGLAPLRLNGGWAGRSGRRKFILADWTGDGRLDLLVNSVNVNLLENVSDEPEKFVFRDQGALDDLRLSGHTSSPAVVRWDKSGLPDLLVGAEDGYFYYLKNTNSK